MESTFIDHLGQYLSDQKSSLRSNLGRAGDPLENAVILLKKREGTERHQVIEGRSQNLAQIWGDGYSRSWADNDSTTGRFHYNLNYYYHYAKHQAEDECLPGPMTLTFDLEISTEFP